MLMITGGAGYIGSHTTLELLRAGHEVVILDNLVNSRVEAVQRLTTLAGRAPVFVRGDVRDRALLDRLFHELPITGVLHFAGLKAVGESVQHPLRYFDNNVGGTLVLCQAMAAAGVHQLVFSSSATVYGHCIPPISESCPTAEPTNPYGQSKLMAEQVLRGLAGADPRWSIAVLRYFNPIGAHPSGLIGEDPQGTPNNLVPYLLQVANGRRPWLDVYGDNYPTPDGTGIRDYIHVQDLARGHLAALTALAERPGVSTWNLGTGRGHSVKEVVATLEQQLGRDIPCHFAPRRAGDVAQCWADPEKAWQELGWRAERSLATMLEDAWRWQSLNPHGYRQTTKAAIAVEEVLEKEQRASEPATRSA